MVIRRKLVYFIVFLCAIASALAYSHDISPFLDKGIQAKQFALGVIVIVSVIIVIFTIIAIATQKRLKEKSKWVIFLAIAIPTLIATLFSAGTTIYLNQISVTKGPVHWHVDFEIWNCGESINLEDPIGLTNRIGTPVLHEHNDFRVHVEGVLLKTGDASLGTFFDVIGGSLSKEEIVVPTNEGLVTLYNGMECDGVSAELQVFVYSINNSEKTNEWVYTQKKVENFSTYTTSPYSNVPPGDCVIIEFDKPKEKTDKMCTTYQVAEQRGVLSGS
jgi:hypothetical protein